jgi:outer membrane protein OmpA-like peptidoglycan-associated protein
MNIFIKSSFLLALSLGFLACAPSDRDHDGIPDKVDECPQAAEDMDNYQDNDGCPELDNDKDKVPDSDDKCPFVPEDHDGFEDQDGCPDKDNDGDGLPDTKDKCPMEKEDRDNFQDADGCPELDNDEDGVLDTADKCPLDKEDVDGFEDQDGCPDKDNDGDGLADNFDKCPNEKENFNGKDDADGCPDADAEPLAVETQVDLRFQTGTANLTFEDKVQLEQKLVKSLVAYPDHFVYVYIFTPKVEMEMAEYLELLNNRTQAVVQFLVSKGIQANQLKTRTVTEELFNANVDTMDDFNSNRPAMFKRNQ